MIPALVGVGVAFVGVHYVSKTVDHDRGVTALEYVKVAALFVVFWLLMLLSGLLS